nr:MAG: hypothetical protein [Bacteriophage sp.]
MKAVKANKQYSIGAAEKASYLAQGFDIIDDNGVIIERSPQSTVPYAKYKEQLDENNRLKAELKQLKSDGKKKG